MSGPEYPSDRECRCDACGEVSRVPAPQFWPGVDVILCRFCGHDLREQTLAKLEVRPSWA